MTRISILPITGVLCLLHFCPALAQPAERVSIESDGWELIGDLLIPDTDKRVAVVLMLNQAAGNRQPYEELANDLAQRGIASLRLDLRGHGESINRGKFDPQEITEQDREAMIWNANADVVAAHRFLTKHNAIDAIRIAIVGASYSGEEMAEAGRDTEFAAAYVALSPGSFSDESIATMDATGVPWLFIVSRNERFLIEITAKVQTRTETVEILLLPGDKHATDLLDSHPALSEHIAVWLAENLGE